MGQEPTVFYVEDDAYSRKVMDLILVRRMGLPHVTILPNSADYLEKLQALNPHPDIIFLDVHVEPHNGFEILLNLRQLDWTINVPIIALTASVMHEEVHMLKTAGFDGCLAKPINIRTFPETFRRICAGERIWRIEEY